MKFEVFLPGPFGSENTEQTFSSTMQEFASFGVASAGEPIHYGSLEAALEIRDTPVTPTQYWHHIQSLKGLPFA